MSPNIANEFAELGSQHVLLDALRHFEGLSFGDLLARTTLSSRTLAKHLKNLASQGVVEKGNSEYHITAMGLEYLARLGDQLRKFRQYRKGTATIPRHLLRQYDVKVTTIEPFRKGHCIGVFRVSLPRVLENRERGEMDRALTEAIHAVAKVIPMGTREYGIKIMGILKTSPASSSN